MMKTINEGQPVVGLDIGTTKICAIVGQKNEYGTLEVLGMGKAVSDGVIRGIVSNIDKTVFAIQKAVREAEEQSGVEINVVNVGIAGQHIRSSIHHGGITRNTKDDEITLADVERLTNDMYRIVTPPGCEIIHVMPQHYIVDYEEGIADPIGMSGVKLEADFHIITAQTNAINNLNKCVQKAGLSVDNLILEPLASSLSVLSEEEKKAGVCLIDIGGGTTDMAIFHDGIIRHTAVIPFGGDIISADIKQGCSVLDEQAELLKVKFGRAIADEASFNEIVSIRGLRDRPPREISVKNLAYIIEARMQEIFELVHAEIIASDYEDRLAGGIVVTGGGSQLTQVKELCELMCASDARVGYPNEYLGRGKPEAIKSPTYATGVGLVLAGFKALDERNLDYVRRKAPSGKVNRAERTGGFSFRSILEKTKKILIDDFNEKEY
ncbi:MAG: cell division protein FtsA [Tunicatimonas sp.]